MNKFLKKTLALTAAVISAFGITGCGNGQPSQSTDGSGGKQSELGGLQLRYEYNGEETDIVSKPFFKYLNAETNDKAAEYLTEYTRAYTLIQTVSVRWEDDKSSVYEVHFADNEDFDGEKVFTTERAKAELGGTLIPGKTYYYKIVGDKKETKADSFKVKDNVLRPINAGGASNIRDLGGWTISGGNIKYGKLYRGGKLNDGNETTLTEDGLKVMRETLGIKTEIDLRFDGLDDYGQTVSVLGDDVRYIKAGFHGYNYILPEFKNYGKNKRSYYKPSAQSLKTIFSALADENNYPIYFHCNAGADRTGTLAFLIEAVLGASEEDVTKDFELTSFSPYGARYRGKIENGKFVNGIMQDDSDNFVAFGYFVERMKAVYCDEGETLAQGVEKYLKTVCGVTDEEIRSLKRIVTAEKPD